MKQKKSKIRIRILKAFFAVLFCSFLLTGVVFNIAIRFSMDGEHFLSAEQYAYADTSGVVGRAGLILFVLTGIMFIMACIISYFLSNSLTRPIEKLSAFALNIGSGDFTENNFEFRERELENLNNALNKSVKQLAVYDSEQKMFFQNVSHELRTPLMSIKCYAEGVAFELMEPKAASETILQETDRLSDLVTDLLYIAKIDNITTVYTTAEMNLTEIIRECAVRQQVTADKRQIRFSFDFAEEDILYECVSELISRALDNLISNAIRYADSEIILSCHKKARHIEIHAVDDGAGIEAETMLHMFERFYKGTDGNHGIGLSIVKSIVEQHGGHITAENGDQGGAVFIVVLPV